MAPTLNLHAAESAAPNFAAVAALFEKHCLDCHSSPDPEGKLLLESHELLMKGGESGAAIVPGKSSESLLVKMIEGRFEKEGKKKIMPPGSKRRKLDTNEIALIKSWIDAGALPDAAAPPELWPTPQPYEFWLHYGSEYPTALELPVVPVAPVVSAVATPPPQRPAATRQPAPAWTGQSGARRWSRSRTPPRAPQPDRSTVPR